MSWKVRHVFVIVTGFVIGAYVFGFLTTITSYIAGAFTLGRINEELGGWKLGKTANYWTRITAPADNHLEPNSRL
ncbi:hypothetical protein Pogu_2786 [Pyrobaculum oguniense TE7]|uniref:Uncharacterized protein n=1 Tax=Pyrobaculum oguniense (strain DSM 13380 / JCM 10595 / TE7) TaxID=698757 RepID=H6QC21_PYROT|nr:hypothetical protein Pogu_2786 [Pyrobaculum oguniense TE7]